MKCSVACIFFALAALAGWYIHEEKVFGDHMTLPPVFWSTVLCSLSIALLLQAFVCWRRA
jgi:hypothetical protein